MDDVKVVSTKSRITMLIPFDLSPAFCLYSIFIIILVILRVIGKINGLKLNKWPAISQNDL